MIFVDSSYYIAIAYTKDQWYEKALELSEYIENSIRCKIHWTDCPNQMVTVQMTPTSDRLIYPCWNTMWIA